MKRIVTALTGAVGLLLLLIGVPTVLWTVGGELLASGAMPTTMAELGTALTERDSGQLFLTALLLIGAAAWTFFVIGFLLELPAVIRRRPARRVRGFGWAQRATGFLLAMIIAGAPGLAVASAATAAPPLTSVTMLAGTTTTSAIQETAPNPASTASSPAAPATVTELNTAGRPTYVVQPRDSLWGIAERLLGDGARAQQILALNAGVRQADGGSLDATSFPRPGWVLVLPSDAKTTNQPATVQVRPGDTLTEIAQQQLGDASRYRELAAANGITDPDVIDAGTILTIPAPPASPTAAQATPEQPPGAAATQPAPAGTRPDQTLTEEDPSAAHTTTAPTAPTPAQAPSEQQPPALPNVVTEAAPEVAATPLNDSAAPSTVTPPTTADPALPSQATAAASATNSATETADSSTDDRGSAATWMGVTAVTAAAIWSGVVAAQRRGTRRRRRGQVVRTPSESAIRTERALSTVAADIDMPWLDLALRSLGAVVDTDRLPDITGAEFNAAGLRLLLAAETTAPSPFLTDGPTWWLPAAATLPITTSDIGDQPAPMPALTSIGTDGSTVIMLDLEAAGALSVDGDPQAIRRLLRHIVVELAHQSWSDEVEVLLVGWGEQLTALNPDRVTVAGDIPTALAQVAERAEAVGAALTQIDLPVRGARVTGIDAWTPQIVIVNHASAAPEQLGELARQIDLLSRTGHAATAIVVAGDPLPEVVGTRLTVESDGTLVVGDGWGGQRTITAAALSQTELDELLILISELDSAGQPAPPIQPAIANWAHDMDRNGGLMPPVDLDEPVDLVTTGQVSVTESPADAPIDDAEGPKPASSPAAAAALAAALAADPDLDNDLQEWHSESLQRPRISVLGPVNVSGSGTAPARRAWFSEVAVYLALHHQGVSLDKFTDDLWPGREINTKTRNESVSRVRAWLGGPTYLPMAAKSGTYRLVSRLVDVEIFVRLRKRGDAYAAADQPASALRDYQAALTLVRGIPLPEVESAGSGWSWMLNSGRRDHLLIPGQITDCAHRAVQVALALRPARLDVAREAANRAHLAEPTSELPLLDLLVIAAAEGDMATAQRRAWEMLAVNGVEAVEDLPDHETFKIIDRIFPHGLKAVSNR